MQRWQKLDAGIYRLEAYAIVVLILLRDDDSAGAAVSLRTTFFGSGASQVLAQVLQDRSGRVNIVKLNEFAIENEFNRAAH